MTFLLLKQTLKCRKRFIQLEMMQQSFFPSALEDELNNLERASCSFEFDRWRLSPTQQNLVAKTHTVDYCSIMHTPDVAVYEYVDLLIAITQASTATLLCCENI